MLRMLLVTLSALIGLTFTAVPLSANTGPLLPAGNQLPAPVVAPQTPAPVDGDFSDADFAQADQDDVGSVRGGDVGGFLIFVLVVILLVLLILWLLREGHVHVR